MLWNFQLRSGHNASVVPGALWRSFLRDRDAAAAVEFGLVAMPFFGLLFAMMQTALVFWSTQVLETAVANASRDIYTEQFATANGDTLDPAVLKTRFKTRLCDEVKGLFDCAGKVDIDVQVVSDFSSASFSPPVVNKAYNASNFGFQMPQRNQVVVVRASLEYPTFAAIGNPATTLASGNQLIMATAAFRTEP
jgi:Flp pilus assembly protein TadG